MTSLNERLRMIGSAAGRVLGRIIVDKALKSFFVSYLRGSNSRIHPMLLLAAGAYLETREAPEDGLALCQQYQETFGACKAIDEGVLGSLSERVRQSTLTVFGYRDEISDNGQIYCRSIGSVYGAAFELWVLAQFHLRYELLGSIGAGYQILGTDGRLPGSDKNHVDLYLLDKLTERTKLSERHNLEKTSFHGGADNGGHFRRKADIFIKGNKTRPTSVELKSYSIKLPNNRSNKPTAANEKKFYTIPAKTFDEKLPHWRPYNGISELTKSDNKKNNGTVHKQVILDYLTSVRSYAANPNGSPRLAERTDDLLYLFHDWTPRFQGKKGSQKLNQRIGVSMMGVSVEKSSDTFTGQEYTKRRLSWLSDPDSKKERDRVGFNLGIESRQGSNFGALYNGRSNVDGEQIVALKQRVKPFDYFGTKAVSLPGSTTELELTKDQKDLIFDAIGIQPDGALRRIIEGEHTINDLSEHLNSGTCQPHMDS